MQDFLQFCELMYASSPISLLISNCFVFFFPFFFLFLYFRGEKAFCSAICRDQEISREEESEKHPPDSPSSDNTEDDIFMAGMVVAT
jgi:zinc-finger of the FCS-type, C2-C2